MADDTFVTLVSIQPAASANSVKGEKFQNRPQACGKGPGALYEARRKRAVIRAESRRGAGAVVEAPPGRRPFDIEELVATAQPTPSRIVRLTWKAQDRCDYVIRIGRTPVFDPATWESRTEQMAPDGTLTITWDHTGTDEGVTYYYAVLPHNFYGDGLLSSVVSAAVPLDPAEPPTILAVVPAGAGAAAAWWNPSATAGATYAIYTRDGPGVTKLDPRTYPVKSPCLLTKPGGGPLYARVSAIGPGGEGDLSPESGCTVLP